MKNTYEEQSTSSANTPEAQQELAETFAAQIGRADGEIIPLSRSVEGKNLMISARLVSNPLRSDSPSANRYFYGWQEDRTGVGTFTGVLLVDMYAQGEDSVSAIGHMDWWLQGDYANGGGNMHSAVVSKTEYEELSKNRWGDDRDSIAFKLEPDYQGEGIGGLMIAASGVALAFNGITKFFTGALLDPAVEAYGRLGVAPDDFPRMRYRHDSKDWIYDRSLPIDRISDTPEAQRVIERFV